MGRGQGAQQLPAGPGGTPSISPKPSLLGMGQGEACVAKAPPCLCRGAQQAACTPLLLRQGCAGPQQLLTTFFSEHFCHLCSGMLLLQPCSASPLSATSQNAPSAVGVQQHSHGTEKKLPKTPPQPRAGKPPARPGWSLEGSSSRKMRCGWQRGKEQPGEEAGDRGHRRVVGKAEPPWGPGRDPLTAPPTAPGGCRTQLQPPEPERRSLSHLKRAAGKNPDPGERAGNLSHLQQPAFLGAGASGQERRAQGSEGLPRGVVAAGTRRCQA